MKALKSILLALMLPAVFAAAGAIAGKEASAPGYVDAQAENARITPNTRFSAEVRFTMCAHTCRADKKAYIGLNEEEFASAFSGRVTKFTAQEVRAVKTVYDYCPEHLVLRAEDGVLAVTQSLETGGRHVIVRTDVALADMPEAARERLAAGVLIESMDKLNETIKKLKE